jgi:hypothetical protein
MEPRNGEVWSTDPTGAVWIERVHDFWIVVELSDGTSCPNAPETWNGIPLEFVTTRRSCGEPCLNSPSNAVRTFYGAAANQDKRTLRIATAPSQWDQWATDQNPDVGDLRCSVPHRTRRGDVDPTSCDKSALTDIRVTAVGVADLPPSQIPAEVYNSKEFDSWASVAVTFRALYRNQNLGVEDGIQTRFVTVGRDAKTKNWLFFTSGTGP